MEKMNNTFIDLFSGIGGFRIAFEENGFKCIFSSEIDKFACKTYYDNFGVVPSGDITLIDEKLIPKFDVLTAGFPCQPFSLAGKQKGFNDEIRGTLFFEIFRILKYHKPRAFLLENVKNLVHHNKGNTFATICNKLKELNYNIHYQVLNSKDFGIPQNRARIYIVGFLDKVDFKFPEPKHDKTLLFSILEKVVDDKYTLSDKLWMGHQNRKLAHLEKGNGFGYKLFDQYSEYSSTISARYYKDGSEILIKQDNKNPRKLTPREAARLQGFPDEFKITCSDTNAYKQFGNSVTVPVISQIAMKIKECLNLESK
jgi:DNA (cytosine-5)-methyltransferase 1